jgi:hypothetical protein
MKARKNENLQACYIFTNLYPFAHVVFWQNNKIMLGVAEIDV